MTDITGTLTIGGTAYTITGVPVTPPAPATGLRPIPVRVSGCYWTDWNSLSLGHVDPAYNLIWVFAATCDSSGNASLSGAFASETTAQFKADLAAKRAAGVCCLLTVGGAGRNVPLTTRAASANFVASIKGLQSSLGPFDGLDFDIENEGQINATELTWIGQQLKAAIPGFSITWAGASPYYITNGPAACQAMSAAGALDMVGVMAYDYGQPTEAAKIAMTQQYVNSWAAAVGAGKVCIGIELPNVDDGPSNTLGSAQSAIAIWDWAKSAHPGIRGMDIWTAYEDARATGGSGGAFVSMVIPAVKA